MTFEHYIITRFNLPIFSPKVNGKEVGSLSYDYLSYRFYLFEQFCYPSIVNQSCQNFKWLVLFDINTPSVFKERASYLHDQYSGFIPCYFDLSRYDEIPDQYLKLCEQYDTIVNLHYPTRSLDLDVERERILRSTTPLFIMEQIRSLSDYVPDYYITTRLDNDDALHKDMVATIQEYFTRKPKRVILDFVNTYKFILSDKVAYSYPLENGHFISLAERSDTTFQSVFFWNHLYVDKFAKVEHFYRSPLQVELIHGDNVVNDFSNLTIKGLLFGLFRFRISDFSYPVSVSFKRACRIILYLIKVKLKCFLTDK